LNENDFFCLHFCFHDVFFCTSVVVYDQWHVIVLFTFGFGLWVNIWVSYEDAF